MHKLNLINRLDRESGQGAIEYLGVIVVAVIILAAIAVAAPGFASSINGFISDGITRIGNAVNN